MNHPAVAEVVRQHHVIEQWLSGADHTGFDSFAAALGDEFEMVTPDGETVAKPELVGGFAGAFGTAPGVKIQVKSARVLATTDELVIVHFEEWQSECAQPNQRVSTAVFAPRDTAPLGWAWIALQETWLVRR